MIQIFFPDQFLSDSCMDDAIDRALWFTARWPSPKKVRNEWIRKYNENLELVDFQFMISVDIG